MWTTLVVKLIIRLLKVSNVSIEQRNLLTAAILDTLQAAPLRAIIDVDERTGELLLSGRPLDMEKVLQLRQSADTALRNPALTLIREQVTYTTFVLGGMKAEKPYDMVFARAALWWGQEVERLLKLLAQRQEEPDL